MKNLFARLAAIAALSLTGLTANAAEATKNPLVEIQTSAGKMVIELYPAKAPKTVENFLRYVKKDFYRGTVFHRVIPGFMIQGGGFNVRLEQKATDEPVPNEADNGLANERGTIAMARRGDPDSATSQFFINHVDNPALNFPKPDGYGYTVFGRVVQGLPVVDKIAGVRTENRGPHQNVPIMPVVIQSVTLLNSK